MIEIRMMKSVLAREPERFFSGTLPELYTMIILCQQEATIRIDTGEARIHHQGAVIMRYTFSRYGKNLGKSTDMISTDLGENLQKHHERFADATCSCS